MAPGEADRQEDMEEAIKGDKRFSRLQVKAGLPVDLCFQVPVHIGHDLLGTEYYLKELHIELKTPQDFVQSVLSGHLYNQTLAIREGMLHGCGVNLGALDAIQGAIKQSVKGQGLRKDEMARRIATTYARCKSFRKRSFLNGIPMFYQGDDSGFMDQEDPFQNIKELAYDFLLDGSMIGFGTRPAEGERELGACNHWIAGAGPTTLKEVLKEYRLALVPRKEYAKPIEEIKGVGEKRAKDIGSKIVMFYGAR
jgi:hypothetical protein